MRTVHRQEHPVRDLREGIECLFQRPELKLEPELERRGFGEPTVGRLHGDRSEPGERLHPDLLACLEVDDRVEHHPHPVTRYESLDVASERLVRLVFDLFAAELGRELRDDPAQHLGREAGAALRHHLDPVDELVGRRPLDEVADGAGPEHLHHVLLVLVGGQRDHPRPGETREMPAGRVRAPAFRHPDVDERDVRQARLGDPDRFLGVGRRPDQLDPILVAEELGEGRAERRARHRPGAPGWDPRSHGRPRSR